MSSYLEYTFTEGGDTGMDARDFLAAEILKKAPVFLKEVKKSDDYRGVLVLAKSCQEFATDWLYSFGVNGYSDDQKMQIIWQKFIFELQAAIWEASIYLDDWADADLMQEEFEAMLCLYKKYTQDPENPNPGNSSLLKKLWEINFLPKKIAIFTGLNQLSQGQFCENINTEHILDQPKIIAQILNLWQVGTLNITFTEFGIISKILMQILKTPIDYRWSSWYDRWDSPAFGIEAVEISAELIWYQSLDSLKADWKEFGLQKFVADSEPNFNSQMDHQTEVKPVDTNESSQNSKNYKAISRPSQSQPKSSLNRNQSIVITGKFGVDRNELESALVFNGFSVKNEISGDENCVLVGFKPGSKLEKAREYGIKELGFTDLLELLVVI